MSEARCRASITQDARKRTEPAVDAGAGLYGTAVENNGNVRTITVAAGQAASGTGPLFSATQVYEYDAINRLKTATEGGIN